MAFASNQKSTRRSLLTPGLLLAPNHNRFFSKNWLSFYWGDPVSRTVISMASELSYHFGPDRSVCSVTHLACRTPAPEPVSSFQARFPLSPLTAQWPGAPHSLITAIASISCEEDYFPKDVTVS